MIPMITISHIAMTSSSFLILSATFERYCITVVPKMMNCLNRYRDYIAALDIIIKQNPNCAGTLAEYTLELSDVALNPVYNVLWRFWFRNIITILLPFFILAFLNAQIVTVLQRNQQSAQIDGLGKTQIKGRVRAATRTLVFVVFTYLLSNILNVIITIWEYIDIESLTTQYTALYIFCTDLVSLLTTLAGSLRLSIYSMCNPQLRMEFKQGANKILKLPLKLKNLATVNFQRTAERNAINSSALSNITFSSDKIDPKALITTVQLQSICDNDHDEILL
uniref:G-protein coupled receptors family 1 profile domain-containing protein n=1 Tax=Setaria digitata TaxID=48799 RepID=A0A915Q4H3_9BILA